MKSQKICPNCDNIMDGLDCNGEICYDCYEELACHYCGWPEKFVTRLIIHGKEVENDE